MKITVVKEFWFEAAHHLPEYAGDCRRIHGHSYRLQVGFSGAVDAEKGMIVDFKEIKDIVQYVILDKLDHRLLNHVEPQGLMVNPTAENMILWIKEKLETSITRPRHVELTFLRLYETVGSYAEWRKEA